MEEREIIAQILIKDHCLFLFHNTDEVLLYERQVLQPKELSSRLISDFVDVFLCSLKVFNTMSMSKTQFFFFFDEILHGPKTTATNFKL